jgi:hypothetical protein
MLGLIAAESRYRAITAQAWAGMLAVLLAMLIADVDRLAIQGSYEHLAESLGDDPGSTGLWILVALICLNALVQVAVRTFAGRGFRRAVFWTSVAYTAFFVLHQAAHVWAGERFSLHTLLDLTHHALGLWACWASSRWLKLTQAVA